MLSNESLKQAHILMVDDDSNHLTLLSRLLRQAGFQNVHVSNNPDGVVGECTDRERCPDLLLLDWQMPGKTGHEVLEAVRAEVGGSDQLPVLVLTSDSRRSSRYDALRAGATDFLTKPIDETELLLRIRNLVQMRFLTRHVQEENRILEERVKERTEALALAQMQFLERLATAAELRDDLTGKHTARVASVSAAIADALGLPPEEVQTIRHAAPLHDVGKLAVPEVILRKPARLTTTEFEVMKTHTVVGPRLLSCNGTEELPLLRAAEQIAASHHEWWNGSGYPDGASGDAIPLPGRIVAVADVYDALTHQRPYKDAWPVDEALQSIESLSGSQFDPLIVEVFSHLAQEGRLQSEVREAERSLTPIPG